MKIQPNVTRAASYQPVSVTLPTALSNAVTDINKFTWFIYGQQKIGKTSFTTQFKNALHLMFEPGGKSYEIYQASPKTWKEFQSYVDALLKEDHKFKTVIIDPVDLCWDMCAQFICDRESINVLKDLGFGDGYTRAKTEFRSQLIKIANRYGLVCISHSKNNSIDDDSDNYMVPSASKTCSDVLAKWCDLTGHYYIGEDEGRFLRIAPSTKMEAGNRLQNHFHYSDGSLIADLPMGNSAEEAFSNFENGFNNKLEKPKPKQILKLNTGDK